MICLKAGRRRNVEKTSFISLVIWLIAIRVTPMFFSFPEFDAPSGRDSWLALLLSTIPAVFGAWVAWRLWALSPDRPLALAIEERAGRGLGRAVNVVYAAYLLLAATISLWELDEILVTTMFVRTPSLAVSGAMMAVIVMAVRVGIEPIARTAVILAGGGIVATALSTLVLLPEIRTEYLFPLSPIVVSDLVRSAVYHASLVDFLVVLPFLLPYVAVRSSHLPKLLFAPVIAHGIIACAMMLTIGVLSYPVLENENFEYLALVRQASLGNFLEQFDALVLTGWIVLGYLRISAFFLAALIAAAAVLGLKDYRPLSIPMGIVVLCLSLTVFHTYAARETYMTGGGLPLNLFFLYVLPLLLWLFLRIRGTKRTTTGARPADDPEGADLAG